MSYTAHTWTNGETITAAKMNNLEEGIAEAAQSGGGYDLVIKAAPGNWIDSSHPAGLSLADFEIVSGSISACAEKVANDEPVSGVLYFYNGLAGDYHLELVAPLTIWDEAYTYLTFECFYDGNIYTFSFGYDNGSLINYEGYLKSVTTTFVSYNS